MPRCKYCHSEITKFDTDICPKCGERNPIDDNYRTMDITQHIDPQTGDFKLYKSKSKKLTLFLTALLGPLGIDEFYRGFTGRGVSNLLLTIAVVGGLGTCFMLLNITQYWIYFALYSVIWLLHIVRAIFMSKNDSLKDARGEFLR